MFYCFIAAVRSCSCVAVYYLLYDTYIHTSFIMIMLLEVVLLLASWLLLLFLFIDNTVSAGIIARKLRSTKVWLFMLFTVPCCSIILFSSEGMKKKSVSEFTPNFFRRSIILVGALLFYNSVFPHFSHISHFRSIINFIRSIIHLSVERKN